MSEYRIANADITLRYDATADDLIDVIEGNRQVMLLFQLNVHWRLQMNTLVQFRVLCIYIILVI